MLEMTLVSFKPGIGHPHIWNSGPLWMFTFPEEAYKNIFISPRNPTWSIFFYFPLRVMVPFSITFGKTKNFWMMPLICSMFLKLCCFLLWKCLIFSPYHTVIFKTVVRYTGYSELIVIDYTHNCSQQRNSIFYKTIHINWNAIGKFESLI